MVAHVVVPSNGSGCPLLGVFSLQLPNLRNQFRAQVAALPFVVFKLHVTSGAEVVVLRVDAPLGLAGGLADGYRGLCGGVLIDQRKDKEAGIGTFVIGHAEGPSTSKTVEDRVLAGFNAPTLVRGGYGLEMCHGFGNVKCIPPGEAGKKKNGPEIGRVGIIN